MIGHEIATEAARQVIRWLTIAICASVILGMAGGYILTRCISTPTERAQDGK